MNNNVIRVKKRKDKDQAIKDAIFAFSGGERSILIQGEGKEISTAVEIAEILKQRMYPSIEISDISLGSRPYYQRGRKKRYNKNDFKKDIVSQIEIEISKRI
ncbi:MAG: DNA/RNA-binding protein Alba 2 [Promethearchaeota archaeon]|jgi:DNA-binding protein Alba|nr:MAG: DNA/RNA-binding protein Alba 2 [Candidatus Lokiarchaeota archaeon]